MDLGDLDILHLDPLDLDTPGLRHAVDRVPQCARYRLLLLQHVVERMLADDIAQRRLRDLDNRITDIDNLDDGPFGIDRPAPDHRVDLDRHIVLGNRLLLLDRGRHRAHIDRPLPLDERDQQIKTRPRCAGIFAELEDHRPFILIGDPHAGREKEEHKDRKEKIISIA